MLGSRDADRAGGFHLLQGFGFAGVVRPGSFVGRSVVQLADVVARPEVFDLARDLLEGGAALLQGGAGAGGVGHFGEWFGLVEAVGSGGDAGLDAGVATAVGAAGRRSVGGCEADARIRASLVVAAVFGAFGIEGVGAGDLDAFLDDPVGGSQVFVDYFADNGPSVRVRWSFTLVLQVFQDGFAVFLHGCYVTEESLSL